MSYKVIVTALRCARHIINNRLNHKEAEHD